MTASSPPALADLLARTALRDEDAFHALYRAAAPKLFGLVLRILKRRELAEDCVQDIFVSIWHRAVDYRPDLAQPFTWMAAIARNRALDMLRAAPAQREIGTDSTMEIEDETAGDTADDAAFAQEARALRDCLAELPPKHRQAIALAYFRGLAHAELAQTLAEPLGSVKTWIRKALAQLKRCLETP